MKPLLSIVIPTIGRESLRATLASIPASSELEIVLVGDCCDALSRLWDAQRFRAISVYPRLGNFGHCAFSIGQIAATGDWICRMDDDDYYTPNGVAAMLEYCATAPEVPAIFKMQRLEAGDILPRTRELTCGNVGGPQMVVPNRPNLPRFGTRYEADYDWMVACVEMFGGPIWREELTVICPKSNHGK